MKRALITGISGQDGTYLAEFLLEKGYEVRGIDFQPPQLADAEKLAFIPGDVADGRFLKAVLAEFQPDEVYNLASQARPDISGHLLETTYVANTLSVVRLLQVLRETCPSTRFFQASSSEIFGDAQESPQTESTPIRPRNPYGISKAAAHLHVQWCRAQCGMFACCGILYNHESPRRGETYVTRKITRAAARIKLGRQDELPLGSLDARRDWGFAGDYVRAMWAMLQADAPDDYIIATGQARTVRELLEAAFGAVGLDWRQYVREDEAFVRAEQGLPLAGNAAKARQILGWEPRKPFEEMLREMVESDLAIEDAQS